MLLGLFLDIVVIMVMQAILTGETDSYGDLIWPVLGISVGNLAIGFGLAATIGLLVVIPMAILTAAVLILLCNMTVRNGLITAAAVVAVRIGIWLAFAG